MNKPQAVRAALSVLSLLNVSLVVLCLNTLLCLCLCLPEHVSGAERGASEERSVQNIVGARSGFLSKGWSDRSVSLRFRSDTAHTTSLGHAQIHPEFTCAFNN